MTAANTVRPARLPLRVRLTGVVVLAGALSACATGPNANPRDPLEPWNRGVYRFNDAVDTAVLKPVATAYTKVTPRFVQKGVRNFFNNVSDAWSSINSLLQLRGQDAMNSFWRFTINSTFGLGGMFDVASEAQIPVNRQDFGSTLGRWGVGAGPYVVLPLIGPSTLRDTVALPVDMKANALGAIHHVRTRNQVTALEVVNQRAELLDASNLLNQAALDPYAFMRDAYLQHREAVVLRARNGDAFAAVSPSASASTGDNDGYVPPVDQPAGSASAAAALPASAASASSAEPPPGDRDGYEPPVEDGPPAAAAPRQRASQAGPVPAPYSPYVPAVPQVLDRVSPGWGANLWRR